MKSRAIPVLILLTLVACRSYQKVYSTSTVDDDTLHQYQKIGLYGEGGYVRQVRAHATISDSTLVLNVLPLPRQWNGRIMGLPMDSVVIDRRQIESLKLRVVGSFLGATFYLPGSWWLTTSLRIDTKDNRRIYVTDFNPKVVKDIKRKLEM